MIKFQPFFLAAVIAFTGAVFAQADPIGHPDVPPLINKIDQFAYAVDTSGSMMMTAPGIQTQKIVLAKEVLTLLNSRIPSLVYTSSVYTVCPAMQVAAPATWDRLVVSGAALGLPVDLPIFGRMTDLGGDLGKLAVQFPTLRGAVILFTDGGDNLHKSAVQAARQLALSGTLLHIISFADTSEGKATVAAMAAANPSTVCVNGLDLLMSPVNLDAFIKAVYYSEGPLAVNEKN